MNLSNFLQAPPNVFIFKYAPNWLSTRYLHLLGLMYYIANREERSLIERNIMMVFKNSNEAHIITKKVFDGIFSHYSEKLIMAYRDLERLEREMRDSIEYTGLEHLDAALENGGVILVTAHFGAVEFLPLALHLCHYPVTMVVSFQTERLRESLINRSARGDVELIDGHAGNVFMESINALRRGRILLTECDEVDAWKTSSGKTIDAFGSKINLDRSLEILWRRSKADVLGSFMIRIEKGYRLAIVPVVDEQTIIEKGISAVILKIFEKFVMMFPDQWYQWKKFHKMCKEIA